MDKNLAQFSLTAKKEITRKKDVIDDLKKKIAEEEARHAQKKRTAVVSEPVTVVAPKKVVPAETEAERLEREEIQRQIREMEAKMGYHKSKPAAAPSGNQVYSGMLSTGNNNMQTAHGSSSSITSGNYGKVNNVSNSSLNINNNAYLGSTNIDTLRNQYGGVTNLHIILLWEEFLKLQNGYNAEYDGLR